MISSSMRIVLVTNGLRYGGAERIVEAIAKALHEGGDRVHVVATTRDGPIGTELRRCGIPVSVLRIRASFDARVPLKLANVARRFRAQLIHSHLAVSDIAAAAAGPFLPGVRLVSTVHNTGIELGALKTTLWRLALRRFDRVMAVSEPVRRSLAEHPSAELVRPSLVSASDSPLPREEARRRLGLAPHEIAVVGVGRLVPVKGFDVLAEAAARTSVSSTRFLVIGEGPEHERLASGNRLELLGAMDDAASLLSAADVVVCPSRSEGFPQVPLHAMAARVPVVATTVGGTPEIVVHNETGLLVPSEDPEALAKALDTLASNRDLARRYGEQGRRRLLDAGFTKESMLAKTRSVYDAVLGSRR